MQNAIVSNGFAMSQEFKQLLDNNKAQYKAASIGKFLKMSNEKGFIVISDHKVGYSVKEYKNNHKGIKN